ncbi:hypothetical protein FOTG_02317 [Fusarium oxysporum f. sp. vasinfectum 25433]|uniref:Uncharacterized protein n=1 Tax=Fusarium oxysporum f. sp. vasinfectum 25433 TaxID=1089449 RepID=X0MJJ1_FUSOX|nr:hypothetical protein FOTG_02317 [Fusarium oxysporum f. sp. vasinfectum 25433]
MAESDEPCFTDEFVTGLEHLIKVDFRKQCRRDENGRHCPAVNPGKEQTVPDDLQ